MNDLYILWLLSLSPKQFLPRNYKLIKLCKDGKDLYEKCDGGLDKGLFSEKDRKELSSRPLDKARFLLDKYKKDGINIISYYDNSYPSFLKEISTPPPALFVKGKLPDTCENPSITIVGTRNCTEEGRKNAARFSYALSEMGFSVVSGMARGIDTYAHKGCLFSGKNPTVAVLAGGVDNIYPPENKELYNAITESGAVISEALPGTPPIKAFFPIRNRILSAITFGTLIIETAIEGGSLITAKYALEQNKLIFAVPGGLNAAKSKGTNALIKEGAILCNGISCVIEEYYPIYGDKIKVAWEQEIKKRNTEVKKRNANKIETLDENEKKIYHMLKEEPLSADKISEKTNLSINTTIALLQNMEINEIIKPIKGGLYIVRL